MKLLIRGRALAASISVIVASIASVASLDMGTQTGEVEGEGVPAPIELKNGHDETEVKIHVDAASGDDVALEVTVASSVERGNGDVEPKTEITLTATDPGDGGTVTSDAGLVDKATTSSKGSAHVEVAAGCTPGKKTCTGDFVLFVKRIDGGDQPVILNWVAIGKSTAALGTVVTVLVKE